MSANSSNPISDFIFGTIEVDQEHKEIDKMMDRKKDDMESIKEDHINIYRDLFNAFEKALLGYGKK